MRRAAAGALLALVLGTPGGSIAAQAPADTAPAPSDSLTPGLGGPSPSGALARSLALPGWGQFDVGSNGRGFAYMAVHGVNTYMVVKTFRRLDDARERRELALVAARDSIRTLALTDTLLQDLLEANPDTLDVLAAADPEARRLTGLSESRRQQREDWMVWAGFWIVASGIDAFVAAHLADFPAQIDVQPTTQPGEARMEVGVRVPLGRRK